MIPKRAPRTTSDDRFGSTRAIIMRKFLRALIFIPLALIFVVFAVANRHFVTVSFDPFNSADPSVSVSLPLFLLIIVVAILGVLAGGSATWGGRGGRKRATGRPPRRCTVRARRAGAPCDHRARRAVRGFRARQ